MQNLTALLHTPLFQPAVDHLYNGILFSVAFHKETAAEYNLDYQSILTCWQDYYSGEPFITIHTSDTVALRDGQFLDIGVNNNTNQLELILLGKDKDHLALYARFDNLGKGAAGAAVQNLNLMLGFKETEGLL